MAGVVLCVSMVTEPRRISDATRSAARRARTCENPSRPRRAARVVARPRRRAEARETPAPGRGGSGARPEASIPAEIHTPDAAARAAAQAGERDRAPTAEPLDREADEAAAKGGAADQRDRAPGARDR